MADPEELGRRLNAVGVSDSPTALETSNNNLFQVMRAVEDAEATIRQQVGGLIIYPHSFLRASTYVADYLKPCSFLVFSWRRTAG